MQKWIEKINKGIDQINKIVKDVITGMLFFMMLLGTGDVIGRCFFNSPINGTLEIFEILLPGIVLLGLGSVQAAHAHIRLDFLVERFSPLSQVIINLISTVLMLAFSILIVWQGIIKAVLYWQSGRVITNIYVPMYLPQLFVPVGVLGLCLVLIVQMFQLLTKLRK